MKILYLLIILIGFPRLINAQLYDTIPRFEGELMIVSKAENERIRNFLDNGGGLYRGTYKIIDSSGVVIEESEFKKLPDNGSVEIKRKQGKKSMEQYLLGNANLTKDFYASGNLSYEHNTHFDESFGFTEIKTYYDNKLNSLEKLIVEKRIVPKNFKGIKIENWRVEEEYNMETIVVEQKVKEGVFVPVREVSFYPNGKIKQKGTFSQRQFFEFRNKEFYQKWLEDGELSIGYSNVILHPKVKLRHGEWFFYNENGTLEKKENYEYGKLIE